MMTTEMSKPLSIENKTDACETSSAAPSSSSVHPCANAMKPITSSATGHGEHSASISISDAEIVAEPDSSLEGNEEPECFSDLVRSKVKLRLFENLEYQLMAEQESTRDLSQSLFFKNVFYEQRLGSGDLFRRDLELVQAMLHDRAGNANPSSRELILFLRDFQSRELNMLVYLMELLDNIGTPEIKKRKCA